MSSAVRPVLGPRQANVETPTRKRTRSGSLQSKEETSICNPPAKKALIDTPRKKIVTAEHNFRKTAQRTKHVGVGDLPKPTTLRKRIDLIDQEGSLKHAQWQVQYRNAFPRYSFYFDGVDTNTKQRLSKHITALSGQVETFFSSKVTHVITSRDFELPLSRHENDKPPNVQENSRNGDFPFAVPFSKARYLPRASQGPPLLDDSKKADVLVKAHELGIKVWKIAKFTNIINNIVGDTHIAAPKTNENLSRLLQEEKLHGSTERDPLARRDDHIYFNGPHVLVRDISNTCKPIIVKEYPRVKRESDGVWPQIRPTSQGKCPFIPESRQRSPDETKIQARSLQRMSVSQAQNMGRFNEIQASGMHMSNLTSNVRSATSTARSATLSVPSKELNCLKRKVLDRNKPSQIDRSKGKQKPAAKPGFCENCRDKYDDFQEVFEPYEPLIMIAYRV